MIRPRTGIPPDSLSADHALAIAALAGSAAFAQTPAATTQPATITPPPVVEGAIAALDRVCLPVLKGGDLDKSAKAAGFRNKDGQWVMSVTGRSEIDLNPPDTANPSVCGASITAPAASGLALRQALDSWAQRQTPPLAPVKMDATVAGPSHQWTTSSWSGTTPAGVEGVVLSQEQPKAGAPSQSAVGQATLLVTLTHS
jgi:hypothetical protein